MRPDSKYFCTSPFSELRIEHDGKLNFCHYTEDEYIKSNENVSNMSVDYYFNHSESIKERDLLIAGGKIKRCERCYKGEEIDYNYFRKRRNLQFGIFPEEDFQQSFEESNIQNYFNRTNLQPQFYHISLSNLCNLGCIMCSNQDSSVIARDWKSAGIISEDTPTLLDWTKDERAWQLFLEHIKRNKEIICFHFKGGEPLYHKRFYEFINFCIDNNHHYFHLTFVTNGTIVLDDEYIKKLKKFKSVQIEISIEGFHKSSDYIRFPSDWKKTKENIEKYLSYKDDVLSLCLRTVPQFLSVMHYDKLLQWCTDNMIIIDSNILSKPTFFKPTYLPKQLKDTAINKLKRFITNEQGKNVSEINVRDQFSFRRCISNNAQIVINQLNVKTNDEEEQFIKMINYITKIDRVRNIDVRKYFPELLDFFNDKNYEKIRYKN